jgi:regulatory protein
MRPPKSSQPPTAAAAYGYCLRLLVRRPYSTQELRERLLRRDTPGELADGVLAQLTADGFLSDLAAARALSGRTKARREATWMVKHDLRQRGIAPELIDQALSERPADEERLTQVVIQMESKYRSLAPEVAYRRFMGALVRRGFSVGQVSRILATYGFSPRQTTAGNRED